MNSQPFFTPLLRAQLRRFAFALVLMMATLLAGVALLGVSGWFLTAAAITSAAAGFNLFGPSALVRGLSLLRILSRYGEKLVGHDATLRLLTDIRTTLFERLFPRVPFAFEKWRRGDLVSRLTADVDALDAAFLSAAGPLLTAIALGGTVTAVLFAHIPAAAITYGAAFLLAVVAVPAGLTIASRKAGRTRVEASAALRMAVLDGVEGHADLVALDATGWARDAVSGASRRLTTAQKAMAARTAAASVIIQMLCGAALLAVLWFGLEAMQQGRLSGPLLVGLLLASLGSFEAASAVLRSAGRLGEALAAAERLRAVASAEIGLPEPATPAPLPPGGSVSFEAVTFTRGGRRLVLSGVALHIEPRSRIALTGPSGAGKSTLLSLLLRLADPQAGRILVAGADIREVAIDDLHRRIALLSQDAPLFGDTIRENLRIGRASASDDDLWEALDRARLGDTVRTMPAGLDTYVGEAGRTLSAGQARRLCLARVLLSGADIIALDEPTSGLDADTERAFLLDLPNATEGRTVILATHASIPAGIVHRVVKMADGRLLH